MKRILLIGILLASGFTSVVKAESPDSTRYEIINNLPVFYRAMKGMLTYPLAWKKNKQVSFDVWRESARLQVIECMMNLPSEPASYQMERVASEQRVGYRAEKIVFDVSEWCRIPAYLLIPDGEGPFPAVVALHDHGAHFSIGKEKMIRPFGVSEEVMNDADDWVKRCYDGQYVGDYLAANGYVVLAIDALFWGERGRKEGIDYNGQQALASNFMQMGSSWGALIHIDDVRSTEFLSTLPEVDSQRIGCVGFSMGAYRSWMLSALTDRIAASASICWMNTTDGLMTPANNQNKGGSAFSMLIPGLRRYLDYPDVASIACPKPALFFNGTHDKLFPVDGVLDAYAKMQSVWVGQQASDKLVTRLWDEKHFYSRAMQEATLLFLNQWLKSE